MRHNGFIIKVLSKLSGQFDIPLKALLMINLDSMTLLSLRALLEYLVFKKTVSF